MKTPTFHERLQEAIKAKTGGSIYAAAVEAGVENTTLWRLVHNPDRVPSLRTFALLCDWAEIDPTCALEEFTK